MKVYFSAVFSSTSPLSDRKVPNIILLQPRETGRRENLATRLHSTVEPGALKTFAAEPVAPIINIGALNVHELF